jgi:hypothetical protein
MGICSGVNAPVMGGGGYYRGFGFGTGYGYGRRCGFGRFYAQPPYYTMGNQKDSLSAEKEMLQKRMESIEQQLHNLSKEEK